MLLWTRQPRCCLVTPTQVDLGLFKACCVGGTGVLTKLDIMDPGTNAREVLEGQAVRLKHGWIGIVNRGQADIISKVRLPLTACQATLGVWQCWQLVPAGSLSSPVEGWNEVTSCCNLSRAA